MESYLKQIFILWSKNKTSTEDSFAKYASEDGEFIKERQSIHDEIIFNSVKEVTPRKHNIVYFVGGPAGVGKSKFINEKINVENKLIINTDVIKKLLPEHNILGDIYLHRESFTIAEHMLHKGLYLGVDIVIETTGKGPYDLLIERINGIKSYGATIDANYLIAPYEIMLQRANKRQALINRKTPAHIIKNSLNSVCHCLPRLIKNGAFDSITVWDTEKDNCFIKLLNKKNGKVVTYNNGRLKELCGEDINE